MSHKRKAEIVTPKDEWETPDWLFKLLHEEFAFNLDAACTMKNCKCLAGSTDALNASWQGLFPTGTRAFLNPPYSAGNIDRFMQKAYEESRKGAVVVCLVPCATDTRWWHNYAMKAAEIRFIKGRVRFFGYDDKGKQIKNSPTFSSCVVIFKSPEFHELPGYPKPHLGRTIEQPQSVKK